MEFNATFLVSAISFLVFVYLMNKIFYTPLENITAEREKLVKDTLNEAQNSRSEAAEIMENRKNKLKQADADSKKLVADRVEKSRSDSKIRIQKAKKDSIDRIDSKKAELTDESDRIKERLDDTVDELVNVITAKILG